MRKYKKISSVSFLIFSLVLGLMFLGNNIASAAIAQVSRNANGTVKVNPSTGFPVWYEDISGGGGNRLQLCLGTNLDGTGPADPNCILPGQATIDPITAVPTNFPGESFYWFAEAPLTINGSAGRFRMALEAAFTTPVAVPNQQIVFARASLFTSQAGVFPASSTFHVVYPFGSFDFTTDAIGGMVATSPLSPFQPNGGNAKEMRAEDGPGLANDFTTVLTGTNTGITRFLTSTAINPVGYIGNGVTEAPVVGGTNGNVVTITQTAGVGPFVVVGGTNWIVAGKIAVNNPPVITPIPPQTVNVASTTTFTVLATDADGDPISFSVAPDAPVVGNMAAATINPTTGVFSWTPNLAATGTRTFTVSAFDGVATATSTATITVLNPAPPALSSFSVAPLSATISIGATAQLTASPLDQFGAPFAGATISFASDNAAVASVNAVSGLVTGNATGTAIITATATSATTTLTATSSITVVSGPVLTTIAVTPATAISFVGGTQQFTATTLDQNGAPIAATLVWSSSNPAVATINPSAGLATGVSVGATTITASSGAISGTAQLTISASPVPTTITVSPASATVGIQLGQQFTASVFNQNGQPMTAPVSWSSSNPTIASVSGTGFVTGLSVGSANIIATSGNASGTASLAVAVGAGGGGGGSSGGGGGGGGGGSSFAVARRDDNPSARDIAEGKVLGAATTREALQAQVIVLQKQLLVLLQKLLQQLLAQQRQQAVAGASIEVKTYNITGGSPSLFRFSTDEIEVNRGDRVRINFSVSQGMHNFVLDEFNVRTPVIQAPDARVETVEFVANKTGIFEYYCSVGAHRSMGMVGKFKVE